MSEPGRVLTREQVEAMVESLAGDDEPSWDELVAAYEALARSHEQLRECIEYAEKFLRYPSPTVAGISAKAMIAYAIGGAFPDERVEFPRDASDLERCERVAFYSPPSLEPRIVEVLDRYRDVLSEETP